MGIALKNWMQNLPDGSDLLALHLCGGTTELLLCEKGKLRLVGGAMDLHAGQMGDRVGVRLGLRFPAGPELEKLERVKVKYGLME